MDVLINFVVSLLPSLIVGVLLAIFNKQQKKKEEREIETNIQRQKSESLKLSLFLASAQLARAVAYAYKRGAPNGEMEDCIEQYETALAEFREFEREQVTKIST